MTRTSFCSAALALSIAVVLAAPAHAEDALVYRGQLQDSGQPASGQYDLEFRVHGDKSSRVQMVGPLVVSGVQVTDGSFAVSVPVGMPMLPESGWVTVAVRDAGSAAPFEPLPGQQVFSKVTNGSCPGTWSTTGNAGIGATNFLGTTDNNPLELRANNLTGLRLEAGGSSTVNVIGGAPANQVRAGVVAATIGGGGTGTTGENNRVVDNFGTIGGGRNNRAGLDDADLNNARFATVGGGVNNIVSGEAATVAGGTDNLVSAFRATVGGGGFNFSFGPHATISGGNANRVDGQFGTIAGGINNRAGGDSASVAGGVSNDASGNFAFVGGGIDNSAAGGSAVALGNTSQANANDSFALGRRAVVNHSGSFAWASGSTTVDWVSTGTNQFIVRAPGGVGLGTNQPVNQLHVFNTIDGGGLVADHVAQIENGSGGSSPDVLALKVNTAGNPGTGVNFITFLKQTGASLGSIQGNGSGGVMMGGPGNDYAEYLRKLDLDESIAAGDVLGVFAGKVSRRTAGAEMILVASSGAIIAGNDPGEGNRGNFVLTAMMGQAELEVSGAVAAGDYLLPSGLDDGRAVAVAPSQLAAGQLAQVIGRAWEVTANDAQTHRVKAVVGMSRSDAAVANLLHDQAQSLAEQTARTEQLLADNAALRQRLASVEAEQVALRDQRAAQEETLRQVSARLDALFPEPQLVQTAGAGEGK